MKIKIIVVLLFCISFKSYCSDDPILKTAKEELDRNFIELSKQAIAPYFLAYNITDSKKLIINSSFGKTKNKNNQNDRILDVDLRVGSYKFDNTHIIRGNPFSFSSLGGSVDLPLDNANAKALKSALWFTTDRYYKAAIERYEKALTNQKVKVTEEDKSNDMSIEPKASYLGTSIKYSFDTNKIEAFCNKLSAKFLEYDFIYDADVTFQAENLTKYIVNSEGSELKWDESYSRMFVYAKTKADDGMSLPLFKSYFSYDPNKLPSYEEVAKDIDQMVALLRDLRKAPTLNTTSVPAILSGEAAGVFFHEIFGHRVEGHREKDPNSSQTFKNSVGNKILPDFIDVVFDPTISLIYGKEISGKYEYDDEGVKSQRVVLVENGVFKNFLMGRSPIEKFSNSNGHGRKQAGYKAVSRQSNLIVYSKNQVSNEKLKDMLRDECKKAKKEFGLYFESVQGGFTFTGRTVPNAFNVIPLVVYKIFADGRKDELVRGVDLIGTPLTTFSNILATSDNFGVFNGICGAESGGIPVSACSPSILVSNIEVQKKKKSQAKLPILQSPLNQKSN